MKNLSEDAVREIERIHSSWIEFEVAGEDRRLLTLCTDDIEFWPPDAQPIVGRTGVLAQLQCGSKIIQGIEISNRRIRGSDEIAYLTANYKTVPDGRLEMPFERDEWRMYLSSVPYRPAHESDQPVTGPFLQYP